MPPLAFDLKHMRVPALAREQKLTAELVEVLELVRSEWSYKTPRGDYNCRWCDVSSGMGHTNDCLIPRISAVLAKVKGAQS